MSRAVVQRVTHAQVSVDGEVIGAIGPGVAVLLGVGPGDDEATARRLAGRVATLRIHADEAGRMNRDLLARFAAHMRVALENDGPVTIVLSSGEDPWAADAG